MTSSAVSRSFTSNVPSYDALSYAWDQPCSPCGALKCGKTAISIPGQKLLACLQELVRQRFSRWIWVDAICINQSDELEKSTQIPLMREIFSRALTTHIWLTTADNLEERFLRLMAQPQDKHDPLKEIIQDALNMITTRKNYSMNLSKEAVTLRDVINCLRSIFRCSWIERVWVQQEAIVAAELSVMCGHIRIPWHRFLEAARWTYTSGLTSPWQFLVLHKARINWREGGVEALDARYVMNIAFEKQATRPEDNILGLLGLISKDDQHRYSLYASEPSFKLYQQFAKWFMFKMGPEKLLNFIDYNYSIPEIHSWCPNFSQEYGSRMHSLLGTFHAGLQSWSNVKWKSQDDKFSESSSTSPKIEAQWSMEDTLVLAKVTIVGNVAAIHQYEELGDIYDFRSINSFNNACLELGSLVSRREDDIIAHARTLVMNSIFMDPPLNWKGCKEVSFSSYQSWKSKIQQCADWSTEEDLSGDSLNYHWSMRTCCWGRTYFITEQGRRGLGSKATRPGDLIVVIENCRFPCIVRPIPGQQEVTLIGSAYVDGIMYGEALSSIEEGNQPWQPMTIT